MESKTTLFLYLAAMLVILLGIGFYLFSTETLATQFLSSLIAGIGIFGLFVLRRRELQQETSSMSQEQKVGWERIRAKGKARYVILGMLGGLLMFFAIPLLRLIKSYLNGESNFFSSRGAGELGLLIAILAVGISIVRVRLWNIHEGNYRKNL